MKRFRSTAELRAIPEPRMRDYRDGNVRRVPILDHNCRCNRCQPYPMSAPEAASAPITLSDPVVDSAPLNDSAPIHESAPLPASDPIPISGAP